MSLVIVAADQNFASMIGDSGHWNTDGTIGHLAPKVSANRGGTLFGWLGHGGWWNADLFWNCAKGCSERMTYDEGESALKKWAADAGPILYATHKTSISNHGVLCGLCPNGRVWVRTYFFIFDTMPMPLPEPTLFFPHKLTLFANGRNKVFVEEMNANRDPVSNALGAYQAAAPDSDLDQMQPAQKGWALATRIMALSTQRGEMVAPPYHTLTIGNPA